MAVLSETVEGISSEDDLDEETDLGTTGRNNLNLNRFWVSVV